MELACLVLNYTPSVYTAPYHTRQAAAVVNHILLQPQTSFIYRVRHSRYPLARQADVCARLLGEDFREAGRVEERPFEFVGVEPVLEVDGDGEDAAVGIRWVEHGR